MVLVLVLVLLLVLVLVLVLLLPLLLILLLPGTGGAMESGPEAQAKLAIVEPIRLR